MTNITKNQFIVGGLIVATAFLLQPFSLLAIQSFVAPIVAEQIMGQNTDGSISSKGKTIDATDLKIRGSKDAQIILVEYSDYQCPFCARFHNTPKEILAETNGKVAWAWKHFPLTAIHPEATPAAVAAECVYKLSGNENFWTFSDILIANQTGLNSALYAREAAKLGVNMTQFNTCIKDPAMAAKVTAETAEGESLGVSGTPNTFITKFVDGKLEVLDGVNGALPKDTVMNMVENFLE